MFDLAVQYVKVNPRSLFELPWYYFSTQCIISDLKVTGPLVPEKKRFKGFYHEQAWRSCWLCGLDCFPSDQGSSI